MAVIVPQQSGSVATLPPLGHLRRDSSTDWSSRGTQAGSRIGLIKRIAPSAGTNAGTHDRDLPGLSHQLRLPKQNPALQG
jgi:hypothetical protein